MLWVDSSDPKAGLQREKSGETVLLNVLPSHHHITELVASAEVTFCNLSLLIVILIYYVPSCYLPSVTTELEESFLKEVLSVHCCLFGCIWLFFSQSDTSAPNNSQHLSLSVSRFLYQLLDFTADIQHTFHTIMPLRVCLSRSLESQVRIRSLQLSDPNLSLVLLVIPPDVSASSCSSFLLHTFHFTHQPPLCFPSDFAFEPTALCYKNTLVFEAAEDLTRSTETWKLRLFLGEMEN